MAPLDPDSEEEESESGPSNGDGMSPLECPGAEDAAVPGPSGIGGSGQPDRELPTVTNAG